MIPWDSFCLISPRREHRTSRTVTVGMSRFLSATSRKVDSFQDLLGHLQYGSARAHPTFTLTRTWRYLCVAFGERTGLGLPSALPEEDLASPCASLRVKRERRTKREATNDGEMPHALIHKIPLFE